MIKNIFIASSKGRLAATIHYPELRTDRLAILCPGYLDSRDYKHLVGLSEDLSNIGFTVVRFDPTGTWDSGGEISDYTTTQYLADIKIVLEYMLKESGYAKILLGGHSRGGQVSLLYAARDSRISVGLGIMPPIGRKLTEQQLKDWQRTGIRVSQRDLPNDKNKSREFQVPYSRHGDRNKYDVINDVKKVKIPIIFITGELDEVVVPEDVKKIFDSANEPKKFIIIPGIGHDYRHNVNDIRKVNGAILKQLNEIKDFI
jgi:pimeloyl-ACP methyl ester carboxylesterase